ncbi:unnamed protein product [Nesidiocoris tenuis]|uniref:Uncharacterized protein n=1 Tax=Nesidiocoris tenuis TaxID=355587 RepID=A0A6H5HLL1_9HEMI|nr:unnamed protein product [Nesidiocoris tenuis]
MLMDAGRATGDGRQLRLISGRAGGGGAHLSGGSFFPTLRRSGIDVRRHSGGSFLLPSAPTRHIRGLSSRGRLAEPPDCYRSGRPLGAKIIHQRPPTGGSSSKRISPVFPEDRSVNKGRSRGAYVQNARREAEYAPYPNCTYQPPVRVYCKIDNRLFLNSMRPRIHFSTEGQNQRRGLIGQPGQAGTPVPPVQHPQPPNQSIPTASLAGFGCGNG